MGKVASGSPPRVTAHGRASFVTGWAISVLLE